MSEVYYENEFATVYHGDCREVLPDVSADVIVTDPPYAVKASGEMLGFVSPNWSKKATHSRGYADHNMVKYQELMGEAFSLLYDCVPSGAVNVSFGGNRTFHQMVSEIEEAGFIPLDVLVFGSRGVAKSKTTLAPAHEIASLFRKPGKPKQINPDWKKTNRWDIPKPRRMESSHLTTKPITWMEEVVGLVAVPGEVVIDPFMGSGTTLISAMNLGLKSIGIEQDEGYCELAANRLEEIKKNKS